MDARRLRQTRNPRGTCSRIRTSANPNRHQGTRRISRRRARSKEQAGERFRKPIVTEIVPLEAFYPAERYHQNYFNQNRRAGYCRVVIAPKLTKLGMPS